jgi:hypothetical protein
MRNPSLMSDDTIRAAVRNTTAAERLAAGWLTETLIYAAWLLSGRRVRTRDEAVRIIAVERGEAV